MLLYSVIAPQCCSNVCMTVNVPASKTFKLDLLLAYAYSCKLLSAAHGTFGKHSPPEMAFAEAFVSSFGLTSVQASAAQHS